MLNYSIHTYQLFVKLSYDEYHDLYKKLFSMNASVEKRTSSDTVSYETSAIVKITHIFRKLKIPGISEIELFRSVTLAPGFKEELNALAHGAYIRINPYNAIHGLHNSTHDIVASCSIEYAARLVSEQLLILLGDEPHKKIKLCRCDFCVNLPFDSEYKASLYIRLLQKCIPTSVLKEPTCINPISHHTVPKYPDSLLLECGSYSFEVYNKQSQMQNKNIGNSDFASGLVRLELRAYKEKLKTLYKYYGGSPKNYIKFLANASAICSAEITSLLAPMIGTGDFVSYNTINKKISKKVKNEVTRFKLHKCVNLILKRKRCGTLLDENNLTHTNWKQLLLKFNKLNCSPITIPSRETIDYLPGIYSWDEYFTQNDQTD